MKTMKYVRYARLLCNGEWEKFQAPRFIGVDEIATHCRYAVLAMFVPKGRRVAVNGSFADGPTWAVWHKQREEFVTHWRCLEQVPLREAYEYA